MHPCSSHPLHMGLTSWFFLQELFVLPWLVVLLTGMRMLLIRPPNREPMACSPRRISLFLRKPFLQVLLRRQRNHPWGRGLSAILVRDLGISLPVMSSLSLQSNSSSCSGILVNMSRNKDGCRAIWRLCCLCPCRLLLHLYVASDTSTILLLGVPPSLVKHVLLSLKLVWVMGLTGICSFLLGTVFKYVFSCVICGQLLVLCFILCPVTSCS